MTTAARVSEQIAHIWYWRKNRKHQKKDDILKPRTLKRTFPGLFPGLSPGLFTYRQETVHFNPRSSTFRWTVHFRRIVDFCDRPLSPFWTVHFSPARLHCSHAMNYSYCSLFAQFELFVVRTVWCEQCERADSEHVCSQFGGPCFGRCCSPNWIGPTLI